MTATLDLATAPPPLQALFAEVRAAVDAELDRRLRPPADDPGRLAEAMWYAATGPGKRLRPALAIAAAEACGGTRAAALPAAVAIEMLHAYTLVHDDLPAMDDDDERRGRPTVHVAFGEAIAILAGDGLCTAAFGTLAELGPRAGDAVAVLARRAGGRELLAGQAIDLTFAGRVPRPPNATSVPTSGAPGAYADLAAIERLHAAKTGALFAAAAELGGIAAGAPRTICEALGRYGMAIGIAFQHADDRDDAEFVEHAAAARDRMRALCDAATRELAPLGGGSASLAALAGWMASRA